MINGVDILGSLAIFVGIFILGCLTGIIMMLMDGGDGRDE